MASRDEVSDPPLRTEVLDDWTAAPDPVRDPDQTALRLVRRGRRRRDDDLGELPGRRPERASSSRSTCAARSSTPTEHHLDYITVRGFELAHAATPVDPADRRPAGPHRPELGQGLDHRGQRHPRRQVLGDLARQGGVDRPQLRDPARRQARLPVPARVRLLRPADRLGPGAHRLARHPPQHDLRLRPERHRRPSRLRVLHDRGQPHPPHRDQARVLRVRDRRHQAARGHRRRRSATTASTTARSAPGSTGRPRAPASRATSSTPTPATSSSRSATARTSSTTTSSPRRRRWRCSARAAPSSTTSCAAPCARAGRRPADPLPPCRTAPRSPATR